MKTYLIFRQGGRRTVDELHEAAARSTSEGERKSGDIRWIRQAGSRTGDHRE